MKSASLLAVGLLLLLVPLAGAQHRVARVADWELPLAPEVSSEPAAAIQLAPAGRVGDGRGARLTLEDWSLLGAAGVLRYLDYQSTEKCASDPRDFTENELPEALVHNKPGFAGFEGGTVVANYYAYRWVARRHRRLARLGQMINLGAVGEAVGGNYAALAEHFPHRNTPLTHPAP